MATIDLAPTNFKETVQREGITLVDWWAPWCGPCRQFAPIYEKVSERHPDITFSSVNTEEEQQLAGSFNIRSIPTLMVFRDGVLLYGEAGALPERALESLIEQARAVDMAEVRKEIEAQKGGK